MANTVKVVIAMGVAGLVNMAMLIMAASTFYYQGLTQVATIEDAYLTLQPLLGAAAGAVFAISLLASGLSSASVGTMAGQVIMQGFLHQHIKPWIRRLVTMLPSLIVIALGLNPTRVLVLLFTTMMLLTACRQTAAPADADLSQRPIKAVTTIGMIGDIVRNVGGERVNVIGLMGPGVDPHLYKASEGDVIRLGEADIVFYNGLHLEAAMSRVFERMGDQIKTVAVTDYIDRDRLFTPEQFEGNYDPHVWFDVTMWMGATERVRDALIEIDPAYADTYRANADDYLNQLAELDDYVKTQAATLPPEKRVIITAHDAFNYFSRAYGFEVRGLQGISTASEAGTADVQGLAKFIVERKIPAIFIESSVPVRNVEAVQEAVRARGWDVQIGGELFSDAMGTPGTVEGTYIGMVKHNIDTIVNALQR